jgi:hypothetical protein
MRVKPAAAAAAAICLLVLYDVAHSGAEDIVSRKFVSGGTIHLKLSAGDYDIVASADDAIRVVFRGDSAGDPDVSAVIDVRGTRADVETDGPNHDGVDARLELPRRANIVVELSAGELTISDIEGSKDVSARAGDVEIAVGEPQQYRHVNASVRIGDLNAEPFNVRKGGFFRSFEWTGKGAYDLRAHLTVGDLTLRR